MNQQELIAAIEALVDRASLFNVTSALELLCYEKAEHVAINWQDDDGAATWEHAGKAINKALRKIEGLAL